MRTFYFQYTGHKFLEGRRIWDYITEKNISFTHFVEPMCGACGVSLYNVLKLNNKLIDKQVHLNDHNTLLIQFLKDVQQDKLKSYLDHANDLYKDINKDTKKWYDFKKKSDKTLEEWVSLQLLTARVSMLDLKYKDRCVEEFIPITKFFQSVEVTDHDYKVVLDTYKDNSTALIYLDPPYLDSYNSDYSGYEKTTNETKRIPDNTEIYIKLLEFIKTCKCKVIMTINGNAMIRYIYDGYIRQDYAKTYGSLKKTTHLTIANF